MKHFKIYSDSRLEGFCFFCGDEPGTRDHIPSKILLDKPYPENLFIVPCCLKCNQSFSLDEEYFACLLECVLQGSTNPENISRAEIKRILSSKPALRTRIEKAKKEVSGAIHFEIEEERIKNVLTKLAKGHAKFDNSENYIYHSAHIYFSPLQVMSEEEKDAFFNPDPNSLIPEIGSRGFQRMLSTNEYWITIQANVYEYAIDHLSNLVVKILIRDYLACKIILCDE